MTKRTCSEEGCDERAPHILGWYVTAMGRRVYVWGCEEHYLRAEAVNVELPPPAWLVESEAAEREYLRKQEKKGREVNLDERSVRELHSTGFGKRRTGDRVGSWRYEPGKRYVL